MSCSLGRRTKPSRSWSITQLVRLDTFIRGRVGDSLERHVGAAPPTTTVGFGC